MDTYIIGAIVLFGLINAGFTLFIARSLAAGMRMEFVKLDTTLAEAIKSTVEGLPLDLDNQVSPFAAWLMEMMKGKMNPDIQVTQIEPKAKDAEGKFRKEFE